MTADPPKADDHNGFAEAHTAEKETRSRAGSS
jgi:hypothetical protein